MKKQTPRMARPAGISQRGPQRSAARPMAGASSPEHQVPMVAAKDSRLSFQPVSSVM